MPSKQCFTCKETKDLSEFWIVKGVPHSYCKNCANAYRNKWYRTESGRKHQGRQARLPSTRYHGAKYAAKKRGLDFTITKDEFATIITRQCIYCGYKLDQTGSSIDRKDSNLGYIEGNVVPCCLVCNLVKSDIFTFPEMLILGRVVKDIRSTRDVRRTSKNPSRPPMQSLS